jgi:hypothetical protein
MTLDPYWLDWANLLLRWAHVIVAIAWIGSSFYFVFLDSSLTPPQDPALKDKGVDGELWAVHGGGFYHPQKYLVAPKTLPDHLHWFYWESYSTWLTGFALFTVLYLFNAEHLPGRQARVRLAAGRGRRRAGFPGRVLARLRPHLPLGGRARRPRRRRRHRRRPGAGLRGGRVLGWPASSSPAAPPSCSWAR